MINIETTFIPLAFLDPPEGVTKVSCHADGKREAGSESFAQVIYTLLIGVPAGVLSAWIYDKIRGVKDKSEFRLRINHKEITEISEETIRRVIEHEIEVEQK